MSKPYIVLIPSSDSIGEPRKACEMIENMTFEIDHAPCDTINAKEVLKEILFELGLETDEGIEVEPISDFMDRVNDELFNVDHYFIGYVNA